MGRDWKKLKWPLLQTLALPSVLLIGWLYYPYCQTGPTLCLWRRLFDIECLGCGLTRAFCFLARGKFQEALEFNLMVVPVLIVLAGLSAWGGYQIFKILCRAK